jgi:hypothetical protein
LFVDENPFLALHGSLQLSQQNFILFMPERIKGKDARDFTTLSHFYVHQVRLAPLGIEL